MLHFTFWLSAGLSLVIATQLAALLKSAGFPLPQKKSRLEAIDGLRGYLAIAVMFHHFFIWTMVTRYGALWEKPDSNAIESLGRGSVRLFFMITGLVFYPRVLASWRAIDWRSLYIGRVFRILPLVVTSFLLITTIIVMRTGARPDEAYLVQAASWISGWQEVDIMGYPAAMRLNAGVLWSLWYEWLFYLLLLPACAAAMTLARAMRLPTICVPIALFSAGAVASVLFRFASVEVSVLRYAPLFAVGMIAYELRSHPRLRSVASHPLAGWIAFISLYISALLPSEGFTLALPFSGAFFVCIACGNTLGGILVSKGAQVLGEISFGIYIIHGTLLALVFHEGAPLFRNLDTPYVPVVLLPVTVVLVLITAGTFLAIERPCMRFGRSLTRSREVGAQSPHQQRGS